MHIRTQAQSTGVRVGVNSDISGLWAIAQVNTIFIILLCTIDTNSCLTLFSLLGAKHNFDLHGYIPEHWFGNSFRSNLILRRQSLKVSCHLKSCIFSWVNLIKCNCYFYPCKITVGIISHTPFSSQNHPGERNYPRGAVRMHCAPLTARLLRYPVPDQPFELL